VPLWFAASKLRDSIIVLSGEIRTTLASPRRDLVEGLNLAVWAR
jgi:hypothetical protein